MPTRRAKNSRGQASRVSRTGRRQADLERELSAERRRSIFRTPRAARFSAPTIAITAGEGDLYRTRDPRNPLINDPRAPLGTRRGLILSRKTPRHGSRKHGSRHLQMLRRFGERLNREEETRRRRIAEQRSPLQNEFNAESAVEATPFNVPVNLETVEGHRPKREQLDHLPVAVPVRSFSSLFQREPEGTESNLYLSWRQHGPALHASRHLERTRDSQIKRRPRSRSQPRRPRSTSR